MASQITAGSIHPGQMLWALSYKCPYWPSIVCASRKQSIHVKFCANGRRSCWVQLENVFEFNGYDSFVSKKRAMKSKMSESDFKKAFDTEENEDWRRAVIEATFIMNKDLDSRLVTFDTLTMLEQIKNEFGKIASNITFRDTNVELEPLPMPERRKTIHTVATKTSTRKVLGDIANVQTSTPSKATSQPASNKGRRSEPAPVTKPVANQISSNKLTRFEKFKTDLMTYKIQAYPRDKLFEGVPNGNVCKICCSMDGKNDVDLEKCSACSDYVHSRCVNNNDDTSIVRLPEESDTAPKRRPSIRIRIKVKIICNECAPSITCFACKEPTTTTPLQQCNTKSCGRCYHTECLDNWKQTESIESNLQCPLHVCHTCFSNDTHQTTKTTKFTYCIKCPTTYHCDSWCIPAGTIILTQKQHICIRHRSEPRCTLPSVDWCFRCGKKDNAMLCCGSCPRTYHMACLNSSEIPDPFLCECCVKGKNPLYGEMVLARYGIYPWWPAVIVPSFQVPTFMYDDPPNDHEFCVRFFGDYSFGWIGRSSVLCYSKSEASKFLTGDPKHDNAFIQAEHWFDKISKKRNNQHVTFKENQTRTVRQPPAYTKTSCINLVPPATLTKSKDEPCICSCTPDDDDPCGPTSNCENRSMCIECDAKHCPSKANCKNQCFERKLSAGTKVVFMDEKKGFGLIAEEFICAGTLVSEYVGELITENERQRRQSRKQSETGDQHYYFMTYSKGLYIDAEKKGNESRFVNHSCDPNCRTEKWTVRKFDRIGFIALKDIEKGTEITTDYDFAPGDIQHKCFCGEKKCKGVIGSRK